MMVNGNGHHLTFMLAISLSTFMLHRTSIYVKRNILMSNYFSHLLQSCRDFSRLIFILW
ncbi:hypothetical protein HMPREF9693_04455 [Klebsiella oxytoca 10-5249]|nr:hypothetical protein HMPREF9693_04455 [Klebsiella oxytoca 10-5249]